MTDKNTKAPMLELFVFETNQLLEQLERLILDGEKSGGLECAINEVFRAMHTLKGSAAMMLFNNIVHLSHAAEDVFYYLRENKPQNVNYSQLTDIVLNVIDFTKGEVARIERGESTDSDSSKLVEEIEAFLTALKGHEPVGCDSQEITSETGHKYYIDARRTSDNAEKNAYEAVLFFDNDCGMENVRAFTLVHELKEFADDIEYRPCDILENDSTVSIIRQEGFKVLFNTKNSLETMQAFFAKTMFLKELSINAINADIVFQPQEQKEQKVIDLDGPIPDSSTGAPVSHPEPGPAPVSTKQNLISVNVSKMDILMDLVGELVIAEAMVTQSPELKGLNLNNFNKAARQLRKITNELQDIVMAVRMVPLSATFHKMNRIVRDMAKKLDKQAELELVGEETEVDKNIIEHISDPLMHLIRNAVDHGIETVQERIAKGKSPVGKIRLEAKNAGGDVWIIIQDDGGGLNKEKILNKARERGLIAQTDTGLTDSEIFSFILHPGFSTKDAVTEFSGRGVGMDVVAQNIEKLGGEIRVGSKPGEGTTISIRIPLTLSIIDGMNVKVGDAIYTIPIISVKESFRVKNHNIIKDTDDNEMILIRGECYPILRLYERFRIKSPVTDMCDGIMVMAETSGKHLCLFADSLLGQQQVVVKSLPKYIKKTQGLAGCTLLGDGSVSLILDVAGLISS